MKRKIALFISIFCSLFAESKIIPFKSTEEFYKLMQKESVDSNNGLFIKFETENYFYEKEIDLGKIDLFRYTACYRNQSCWMVPSIGESITSLPEETQFLLIENSSKSYTMYIPLIDNVVRCSLKGNLDKHLYLTAETGDTLTTGKLFTGLYILKGNDPYQMIRQAVEEISEQTGNFKLKKEKPIPWFVGHFGWSTYNAFYENLTSEKIKNAMRNFQYRKIPIPYLLLDVGWQQTKGSQLLSLDIDKKKFPEGLNAFIYNLKSDYGVEKVVIWQAMWGYWQGLVGDAFPKQSRKVSFLPPPRMNWMINSSKTFHTSEATAGNNYYPNFLGQSMYIPHFIPYYQESFDFLRKQGVDGVKIDAITWVEANANGQGGRVKLMKELLTGLQSAAAIHFNNELLNCSASSNDYFFQTLTSNVTRTSTDFFPNVPESHGMHIFTNAQTGFWLGDIILPDWDMFQSGHMAGDFHAAARAISGGPIYSSDEIGKENRDILMKLMTIKGEIPLCTDAARICRESLFIDPTKKKEIIKIFNNNHLSSVVGAFNCSYSKTEEVILKGKVCISDIVGIAGSEFVIYNGNTGKFKHGNSSIFMETSLKPLEYEVFTIVPVCDGFAPIGITSMYNPGGTVLEKTIISNEIISLKLLDGGTFMAYSSTIPKKVSYDDMLLDFKYNPDTKMLNVNLPRHGRQKINIKY